MIGQRVGRRASSASGYASQETVDQGRVVREGRASHEARARGGSPRVPQEGTEAQSAHRVKGLATIAAASVAVALVAIAYGTWSALSAQASIEAAGADAQSTLVAVSDIQAGDVLEASSFDVRMVPSAVRTRTALDESALQGTDSLLGQRALVDLPAGSQITPEAVTGRADSSRLSAAIAADCEAVTVAVDAESGIAGQLRPSDYVRVVGLEEAASGESLLTTLCENVRVVSLDADRMGSNGAYTSVTLEVLPHQADGIRAAQWTGEVSLVLAPALSQAAEQAGATGANSTVSSGEEVADG